MQTIAQGQDEPRAKLAAALRAWTAAWLRDAENGRAPPPGARPDRDHLQGTYSTFRKRQGAFTMNTLETA